jgi:hypothetical protein
MRRTFHVERLRTRIPFLILFAISPWMMVGILSVHLDIVAVTLALAGLAMLTVKRPSMHFVAALLVTMGYWIRFHYLMLAIFYVPLVLICRWDDCKIRRAAWATAGFLVGIAVPTALYYWASGTFGFSNQKCAIYQFALLTKEHSWCVDYQLMLEKKNYSDIFAQINWIWAGDRFVSTLLTNQVIFLLLCTFVLHIVGTARRTLGSMEHGPRLSRLAKIFRTFADIVKQPTIATMLYVLAAIMPFVFVRALPPQLAISLMFVGIPWAAAVYSTCRERHVWGMVLAVCLLFSVSSLMDLRALHGQTVCWRRQETQLESVIPASVRSQSPEKIFCTLDSLFNGYNRYLLWNPVEHGGWGVRAWGFKEEFGIIDVAKLHVDNRRHDFDFIVLQKDNIAKCNQYDASLLSEPSWKCHVLDDMIILEKRK